MKDSKIEWTDHTVNHWWGCYKVSPGCANCYAEALDARWHADSPSWGKGTPRRERLQAARKEALALDRKAERLGVRFRVFGNSMSDFLDPEVPIEWLAYRMETQRLTPHLDWQDLTKRPELWRERVERVCGDAGKAQELGEPGGSLWGWTFDWLHGTPPPNVWIGTSVEDQSRADERIPHLLRIPARVRFLSCEPLLGGVRLDAVCPLRARYSPPTIDSLRGDTYWTDNDREIDGPAISWVIVGGESGPNARPMHLEWAEFIVDQCRASGVPVFVKQLGAHPVLTLSRHPISDRKGAVMDDWPESLRVRELPEVQP